MVSIDCGRVRRTCIHRCESRKRERVYRQRWIARELIVAKLK